MNNDYRLELLRATYDAREREVTEYQVNIDNFLRAIAKIDDDDLDLHPFREQLRDLLASSLLEQRKAQIMRDVVRDQLAEDAT